MPYQPPPLDTWLAARTAEMLALPNMVCRFRKCRRRHACSWHFRHNNEPACLRNLTSAQRLVFDEVYKEAHFAGGFLGTDSHQFETRDGPQRLMDDVAIAIARDWSRRWWPIEWDPARRKREKRMAAKG